MRLLEDRIRRDGVIKAGDILKVDSFLNHQIDVAFVSGLGREFYRLYGGCNVNKILTIEASGIGIACLTAQFFGCPVVFAKKAKTKNISSDVYSAEAVSYTHGGTSTVVVSKEFLSDSDRILIIDDFLANGAALTALASIAEQAGATVVGAGIVIEKAYQPGGDMLRARGMRVESLAKIKSMSEKDGFVFCD